MGEFFGKLGAGLFLFCMGALGLLLIVGLIVSAADHLSFVPAALVIVPLCAGALAMVCLALSVLLR